jgi:hypothetical protein
MSTLMKTNGPSMSATMKMQAMRFIQVEKARVLQNYENGTVGKEQSVGSLNTLYQMASYLEDVECMKELWHLIHSIQHAGFLPKSRFHAADVYQMV